MGLFKIESIRDLHNVRKAHSDLAELLAFLEHVSLSNKEDVPMLRLHIAALKATLYSLYDCIQAYGDGVQERAQRQEKYKEQDRLKRMIKPRVRVEYQSANRDPAKPSIQSVAKKREEGKSSEQV